MDWIDNLLEPDEIEVEEERKGFSIVSEEFVWNSKTGEIEIIRTIENYNADGIITSVYQI